jgi:cbb3-type cytochrome oxidase maturation protein
MEILFLLIPLSVVLVLLIMGLFAWALNSGQFDDIEQEGQRILTSEGPMVDRDQRSSGAQTEESVARV